MTDQEKYEARIQEKHRTFPETGMLDEYIRRISLQDDVTDCLIDFVNDFFDFLIEGDK